jgi:hypothetical protein
MLTAMDMKSSIFWDIPPCILLKDNKGFRRKYLLHLQGWRISRARKQFAKQNKRLAEIFGLFLDPEDGGDIFLRNVG